MSETTTLLLDADTATRAVVALLEKNRSMYLSQIHRHERDFETAKELLSVATLSLLNRAQSGFEVGTDLEAYVFSSVMNTARTYAKEQAVRKGRGMYFAHELGGTSDDDEGHDAQESENIFGEVGLGDDPCAALEQRMRMQAVEEALQDLSTRWPEAVSNWRRFVLEDVPAVELAQEQGHNDSQIRKQIFRVNQALKERMQELSYA